MRALVRYGVHHPVVGNLLMALLVLVGAAALFSLKRETFPDIALDIVRVQVVFPGASPQEVERGVCVPIEGALRAVAGVDQVRSIASENGGVVAVTLERGADPAEVLRDVESEVDGLRALPKGAEKPVVTLMVQQLPVIELVVHGAVDRLALEEIASDLRDRLRLDDAVSQVDLLGVRARELSIELSEAELRRRGVTFEQVGAAVAAMNVDMTSGTVRGRREELRVRTYGEQRDAASLAALPIMADPAGHTLTLGDVAVVRERLSETPDDLRFDGSPAVSLRVSRGDDDDTLDIVAAVKAFREREMGRLPAGVQLTIYADMSKVLRDRINLLLRNGGLGLLLVFFTLTAFLSLRLSVWVAAGIPASFGGTFIVLAATGDITINVISLFGLIIVSGVLVDDAIVVGENIYSWVERGVAPKEAAVEATLEVLPAVIASVVTTMIAFAPLFFAGGMIGKFVWQIGVVVIVALAMSLVESSFVLPAHLAHSIEHRGQERPRPGVGARGLGRVGAWLRALGGTVRRGADAVFVWWVRRVYVPSLRFALLHRWTTVVAGLGAVVLCLSLVEGGELPYVFFPRIDSDDVAARFILAPGTPEDRAVAFAEKIERDLAGLAADLKQEDPLGRDVVLRVRTSLGRHSQRRPSAAQLTGAEVVEVAAELLPGEDREPSSREVAERWRERVGDIPGAQYVFFGNRMSNTFGKPIQLGLLAEDRGALAEVARGVKQALRASPGVFGVGDDSPIGPRDVYLELTPTGRALGLTVGELAVQLRQGLYGLEVQRVQRGDDELKVVVRYPDRERVGLGALRAALVRTRDGRAVPLAEVATWSLHDGTVWLKRLDGRGAFEVFADLDESRTNAEEVLGQLRSEILPALLADHPGVEVTMEGQQHEQRRVFSSTSVVLPAALLLMTLVLVLVFQSVLQTFLILFMIPFGLVGTVLSHIVWGLPLTVLSVLGFIALSGVVINDAVVFVDKINDELRRGVGPFDAAALAGQARFRAIILTTLTTAAGLGPLVMETSLQAQFLIPMALTLAGGLVVGTLFTLVVLPAAFLCLNDIRRVARWLRLGRWPTRSEVEPAFSPSSTS